MELSTPQTQRKSVVFIEFLRIFASFSVIANHTASDVFLNEAPGALWYSSVLYFLLSRTAVPVFLMIVGFLMLDKQYSYRKILTLLLRTLGCLFLFSGGYYVFYRLIGKVPGINPKFFLTWILREPITNAFWYLYLYPGILLVIPFLQKMTAGMKKRDFHVFFLISGFFFGLFPIICHFFPTATIPSHFNVSLFHSYFFMLLAGCYFKRYCPPRDRWGLICLGYYLLCCILSTLLTAQVYWKNDGTDYLFWADNNLLPLLLASAAVFYGASCIRFGPGISRRILSLGRLTFGIYLFGDFFILLLKPIYSLLIRCGIPTFPALVCFDLLIFFSGAICTWILKKLPVLRKIL